MPPTTLIHDCKQFAAAITSVGGVVPNVLGHLLSSYEVLASPGRADAPEMAIMDAALDGSLDEKTLAKLAPAAASAAMTNTYVRELARTSEHTLVGQWHRQLAHGGCDAILDSVRGSFDEHAEAIAVARSLINPESTAEHVIESGQPELVTAWQQLDGHLRVVAKIGAIAAAFGPRLGNFPQIREYAAGENFRLDDRAIMCCAGLLATDSAAFSGPDRGHRTSPWARCTLKLHTIDEARDRYRQWAAAEWERLHSGPRAGWVDEQGKVHEHPKPTNPYAPVKVST
jgi:hypothetical protein